MGYELHREIRALLPPGKLTPLERHLILEIADQCGDDSREGFPGSELLALLIDKPERTVEETLKNIAKKWIELRVELGKGSDGRPYYSHRKKRTTFRFPAHAELASVYEKATGIPWASSTSATLPGAVRKSKNKAPDTSGASGRKPPTSSTEAPDFSVESPRESRGPFPQVTPHNYNPSPEREIPQQTNAQERANAEGRRLLTAERNYSPAEAEHLIKKLNERHGIYSYKWWRTANENGTLDDRIEEVKEDYWAERAAREAAYAAPDPLDTEDLRETSEDGEQHVD